VTLRIGTRRSKLALAQAEEVATALAAYGIESELVPMSTLGDRGADPYSDPAGAKGLFVTEIERALRDGEIDLAVHSAKDLPARDDEDLAVAAVPERLSPLDVLVTRDGELAAGSRVGTSSVRRQAQVFRWRPDVLVKDVRGNVDTRLRTLDRGEFHALVLACAGLRRLGLASRISAALPVERCVPAPGQGILAIETRQGDDAVLEVLQPLHDEAAGVALAAERSLVEALGGDCRIPLGALARLNGGGIEMEAIVCSLDGCTVIRRHGRGPTAHPERLGRRLADELVAAGASDILDQVRHPRPSSL
jgi:hydroxymethylbilane synthase